MATTCLLRAVPASQTGKLNLRFRDRSGIAADQVIPIVSMEVASKQDMVASFMALDPVTR
jgi:hypothetical protein